MPHAVAFALNLIVSALGNVLVLGGATAGIYAFIAYLAARARMGGLDQRFARRQYRRAGAILVGVGTLAILVPIPRFFTSEGPPPGAWGLILAGVTMIALGRILMNRLRDRP